MDHPARCGMTATSDLLASPSQAHNASCQIESDADASFTGYRGLPGSLLVDSLLQPMDTPFPGAFAYAFDPVGVFEAEGNLIPIATTGGITTAYEFDNGGGSGTDVSISDVQALPSPNGYAGRFIFCSDLGGENSGGLLYSDGTAWKRVTPGYEEQVDADCTLEVLRNAEVQNFPVRVADRTITLRSVNAYKGARFKIVLVQGKAVSFIDEGSGETILIIPPVS